MNEKKDVMTAAIKDSIGLGLDPLVTSARATLKVELTTDNFKEAVSEPFVQKLQILQPNRFEQMKLTAEMDHKYFSTALALRLDYCSGVKVPWEQMKGFYFTPLEQEIISSVGIVEDNDASLTIIPILGKVDRLPMDEMERISNIRSYFTDDTKLMRDAFPRTKYGDQVAMSFLVKGDSLITYLKGVHSESQKQAALLNATAMDEAAYADFSIWHYEGRPVNEVLNRIKYRGTYL